MLVAIFINILLTILTTAERDISEVILTFLSPCTASSLAFSVNAFWRRIRDERTTWRETHWLCGIMKPPSESH